MPIGWRARSVLSRRHLLRRGASLTGGLLAADRLSLASGPPVLSGPDRWVRLNRPRTRLAHPVEQASTCCAVLVAGSRRRGCSVGGASCRRLPLQGRQARVHDREPVPFPAPARRHHLARGRPGGQRPAGAARQRPRPGRAGVAAAPKRPVRPRGHRPRRRGRPAHRPRPGRGNAPRLERLLGRVGPGGDLPLPGPWGRR